MENAERVRTICTMTNSAAKLVNYSLRFPLELKEKCNAYQQRRI